jgi:hypothetical protein
VCTLSSYDRICDSKKDGADTLQIASQQPRKGNVLIGTFKMSTNYNYCKPGDIYELNPKEAILNPLTNQPSSHAVMIIGGVEASVKSPLLPKRAPFCHAEYSREVLWTKWGTCMSRLLCNFCFV